MSLYKKIDNHKEIPDSFQFISFLSRVSNWVWNGDENSNSNEKVDIGRCFLSSLLKYVLTYLLTQYDKYLNKQVGM